MNEFLFTGGVRPEAIARLRELGPGDVSSGGGSNTGIVALLLEVFGPDLTFDLDRLTKLTDHPDPHVRRTALQWASHFYENAGDVQGAIDAGRKALALCEKIPDEGPWSRALIQAQLAGHATQLGDWELCTAMATEARQAMDELGAVEDSLQLRSVLALADLSQGRLEQAREAFVAIAAHEHTDRAFGWSVGLLGQAELALAEGDIDGGLGRYRRCIEISHSRRMDSFSDATLGPWTLYAESSALFASVIYGRREEARDLADVLRAKAGQVLSEPLGRIDYPVTGCVLLALGAWDLTGEPADPEPAIRALALAQRFAYQRILPTMGWANVERLAESHAPGLLPSLVTSYDDRLPAQLHEEAVRAVSG
jgi:tetratricopeptide (TPR) repeat protein